MNLKVRYTCPFDSKHVVQRPLGDLARHMGMTDDKVHKDWRKKHGLPEKMDNMQSLNKMLFEITQAIIKDGNLFNPQKK